MRFMRVVHFCNSGHLVGVFRGYARTDKDGDRQGI
jgi:hypothetical protein